MKKTVACLAMAVSLSCAVAQAAGMNWEFNTLGDTEGWVEGADGFDSLTNGIEVASGVGGVGAVLTAPDVTGIDPQLVNTATNSAGGEYWNTIEIRMRQLDGNGGTPVAWSSVGCALVVNGIAKSTTIGGSGWDTTVESNGWIVTTFTLPYLGTDDITYLRVDPVGNAPDKNFEVDYIRLTTAPAPPALPVHDWEFDAIGDTEGWVGASDPHNSLTDGIVVAAASSGSETVLTTPDVTGIDPQLVKSGIDAVHGRYWTSIEIRARQLDGNGGNPVAWSGIGCAFVVNGVLKSSAIGGSDWITTTQADGWIVTSFDLSYLGFNNIDNLRIDPVANDDTKNFEVDYIRLGTRSTPLQPAPIKMLGAWEFNTVGDTGNIVATAHVDALTVAPAINGSESVLTCADVTGVDPRLSYNQGSDAALALSPDGPWKTMEIRLRQLDGNPGDAGVASQPFNISGTLVFINPGLASGKNLGGIVATTNEADNWIVAKVDISYLGMNDLVRFWLDPVGNDDSKNFEVDYVRLYAEGGRYDAWTSSFGLADPDALPEEDPDSDGFDNLYEYAFNGNPTNSADQGVAPVASAVEDGGSSWLEYVHLRRSEFNNGLDYALELKDDLVVGSWTNIGTSAVVGTGEYSDDYSIVTNRIATDAAKKFLQLDVEKQ